MIWYIAVAVFFPCVAAVLSFSFPFRAQSPTADILPGQSYLQETMDEKVDCGDSGPRGPERRYRFSYGYGPGVDVYGWPSKGGIYTLHNCLGVELEFLGFDRFDLPRDLVEPQSEEDEHCDRMRRLGATWWKNHKDLVRKYHVVGPKDTDEFLQVGWPETGGVWVLHTTLDEAGSKGVGLLSNAYTMQERCMMIERLGGVFYANPADCPYLDLPPAAAPAEVGK